MYTIFGFAEMHILQHYAYYSYIQYIKSLTTSTYTKNVRNTLITCIYKLLCSKSFLLVYLSILAKKYKTLKHLISIIIFAGRYKFFLFLSVKALIRERVFNHYAIYKIFIALRKNVCLLFSV